MDKKYKLVEVSVDGAETIIIQGNLEELNAKVDELVAAEVAVNPPAAQ